MRPAKVYKVKIRENVLRQMILTDTNIAIGLIIISGASSWFLTLKSGLPTEARVFISLIVVIGLLLALTARIDRQPSYIVLFRLVFYSFRKRSIRN